MENITLSNLMSEFARVGVLTLVLMLVQYVLVLLAVLADLWSGLRKAKRRGEMRNSRALRRTVDKLVRYYNALMAMSVVDFMQMAPALYLNMMNGYELPVVPVFTALCAIGEAIIEVKSIYEHAESKHRDEYREAAELLQRLAKNLKH